MADLEQKRWEVYSSVLASTGLTLRYSPKASTASYDLQKKEVVLPVWECLDEDATQALTSHEIGHAKHSDFELEVFREMTMRYGDLFNVVEDARIERLMKMEFQGLGSIFKAGYRTLADEGVFPLDGIEAAPLVERLNAFAKFGFMKDIPFSKEEASFSYRLLNLSTKTDVVDLCEDILAYIGKAERDRMLAEMSEGEDGECIDGSASDAGASGEDDEAGEDGGDSVSQQNSSLQRELTDQRMRQMEQTIAKETEKINHLNSSSGGGGVLVLESEKVLQASEFRIKTSDLKRWQFSQSGKGRRRQLAKMVEKIAQSAASMFCQKQSAQANASRKRRITGKIDARRLAHYSISDAVFRQAEKVASGKSHGVVLLLDYSISMEDAPGVLLCACIQAAILARFCQMVNIPFSVYLFGCGIYSEWNRLESRDILKIASDEWLDVDLLLALAFTKHNSGKSKIKIQKNGAECCICTGCSTPLLEAVIAGRRDLLKMKAMGIEKPVMFIATDGAYNDVINTGSESYGNVHVVNARKVILDGKSCGEGDFRGADMNRLQATGGLAFELLARYVKKETGADIVFSSIASADRFAANIDFWNGIIKAWTLGGLRTGGKVWMQNYIEPYLYKHSFLFGKPVPASHSDAVKNSVFAKAFIEGDSIVDLFLTMNTSILREIEGDSKQIEGTAPDAILAWLKASSELLKAYRGLASAFVEFFA